MRSLIHEYREAVDSDIPYIVQIHQAAFPGFFMTMLGPEFLEGYYRFVFRYPGKVLLVKEGEGGLEGFVAGFLNPGVFYTNLRARRWRFIGPILLRICTHPWLLPRLFASYAQARRSSQEVGAGVCELSSIAVPPDLGGRGIGKGLVRAFLSATRGKANLVELTTDAEGNDAVNAFYQSLGFTLVGSYERSKGRRMNKYRLSVEA
jgi:ribosomal protein S18 acetylase RimI-like enzyme